MENEIVKASIITIGDELMIGQVTDTNSAWIAQQLNKEGIWIRKRVSVGDDRDEIIKALNEECISSKIILITGGLGPTADDITKPLLCEYFGMKLITDQEVLMHVQHLFENIYKRTFTDINRKQAEVPDGCTVLHNPRGTAPGMWFEKDDVIYVSMPGVPHEMKGMMSDVVIPKIRTTITSGSILHKTLLTAGIGESALAEHIKEWEAALPPFIKLAYLPNYGMVRLRITGTGSNPIKLDEQMSEYFNTLVSLVNKWLVAAEDKTMVQVVSNLLRERNKKVVTAESCTGGYISQLITSEPGSSAVFNGAVVSYANSVKKDILEVDAEILEQHGAVSEQTVTAMVKGALIKLKGDYAIATSGIMGPDGGTADKPVGTVWVGVGNAANIVTQKFSFRFDRARNIEITAVQALNMMRKILVEEKEE
ncbi:MAG TPA: CinA family nicotinamide mononucleotide deamidase-related protein [Flavitalea sp.]|nr:CinA family nicotinamide mononucleotide deamidase-related protein [Flavitalea sp.]